MNFSCVVFIVYLEKCLIVKGKGKNFVGDIIYIHKDFVPTLKKIDNIAKQCHIKLAIKGSYEQVPDLSKPLKLTTANVGKRIRFVVMDQTGKKLLCNNICLASMTLYYVRQEHIHSQFFYCRRRRKSSPSKVLSHEFASGKSTFSTS